MQKGEKGNVEKWRKEELTEKIINACINVPRELGAGFLENIYHNALIIELDKQNLSVELERKSIKMWEWKFLVFLFPFSPFLNI